MFTVVGLLSGKYDWKTALLATGILAGVHAITAIPKYGFSPDDHLADAAYNAIGASVIPISKMKSNKKWMIVGQVGVYIIAYPHSSP